MSDTDEIDELYKDLTTCPADASPETLRELSDRVLLRLGWYQQRDGRLQPDQWMWLRPGKPPTLFSVRQLPNPAANSQDAVELAKPNWWKVDSSGQAVVFGQVATAAAPALAVCAALVKAIEAPAHL